MQYDVTLNSRKRGGEVFLPTTVRVEGYDRWNAITHAFDAVRGSGREADFVLGIRVVPELEGAR